jgi:hypothetical protein
VAKPPPMDLKKEETLPQIAEMLQDPRFAREVGRWAKEEHGATAADKRDREDEEQDACVNKKTGTRRCTASGSAIAAIMQARSTTPMSSPASPTGRRHTGLGAAGARQNRPLVRPPEVPAPSRVTPSKRS